MMRQPLADRLDEVGRARGEEAALVVVDRRGHTETIGWSAFAREVALTARRVARSSASLVRVPAALDIPSVVGLVAVLSAGRTAMPVDPHAPGPERDRLRRLAAGSGLNPADIDELGVEPDPSGAPGPGGYALVTGGSTGLPRLVVRGGVPTYDTRRGAPEMLRRTGWQNGQNQLLTGPLHHAAPFARLVDGVLSGNTLVLPQVFAPALILDVVARHRIHWAQLTPIHMRLLDPHLPGAAATGWALRGVLHTAAPCPHDTKRRWIDALGPGRIHEMYTATEGIGTTLCDGREWLARPGTVGRGYLTRVRIGDDDGNWLPAGEVGQVYMRTVAGSVVMAVVPGGGAGRPANGFRTVGDRGHLDADGYLFLHGRREDTVIVGGENVYWQEVVDVVLGVPGVADAAVTGVADPLLGARLVALVAARPGAPLTPQAVVEHCVAHLAPHKVPARVRVLPAVPRTQAGKLDREAVLRHAEGSPAV